MQFEGAFDLDAPPEQVWRLCLDPHRVAACVPGIAEVLVDSPTEQYRMRTRTRLGAMTVELELTVVVTLKEEPERARMKIRGRGSGSHVGASSYVVLSPLDDGRRTRMDWAFVFTVYGKLATLGQRQIERVFDQVHGEFTEALRREAAAAARHALSE